MKIYCKSIEKLSKIYRTSIEHLSKINRTSIEIYRNLVTFFRTFLCHRELYCTHFSDMPGGPVGGHPSRSFWLSGLFSSSLALFWFSSLFLALVLASASHCTDNMEILDRFGYITQVATLRFWLRTRLRIVQQSDLWGSLRVACPCNLAVPSLGSDLGCLPSRVLGSARRLGKQRTYRQTGRCCRPEDGSPERLTLYFPRSPCKTCIF